MLAVSLIMTVLNEGRSIAAVLESLCAQTCPPTDIVIVDGGSTDNTRDIIASYQNRLPIRVLLEPGCNISEGRNRAIAATHEEIIAVTDAGVRIPPEWVERLTQPLHADSSLQVVAGFFLPDPDPHKPFEVAMSATVLPRREEIQPETFLPSSRSVAFRKSAWAAVGGYPEWLDYCEDLIFDLRLKNHAGHFAFVPDAVVYFKPRTGLGSFYKQYYRYARGDGKADLWRKRHAARYITYLGVIPGIAVLAGLLHPAFVLLYGVGGAVYMRQPYQRIGGLWGELSLPGKMAALVWIPVIRVVGDVAKMVGYPIGWRWRQQNQPPDWKRL